MNHGGTLQCNEMDKEVFNEILLKKRKIVDLELILTPHAEGHYVSMTWGPEEKRTFLGHTLARAGEAQLTFADDRTLRLCYRHLGRGKSGKNSPLTIRPGYLGRLQIFERMRRKGSERSQLAKGARMFQQQKDCGSDHARPAHSDCAHYNNFRGRCEYMQCDQWTFPGLYEKQILVAVH